MERGWRSVEEVAEYLGVVKHTIYRWIERKGLPAHKVGKLWKLEMDEVDRWIRAGERSEGVRGRGKGSGRRIGRSLDDLLEEKRDQIFRIAARHGARRLRVFGSVARGEADPGSDVDFLVEIEEGRSLLDLGGLLMDLRALLGWDVDVVTEDGLKPSIRERVLREAVPL